LIFLFLVEVGGNALLYGFALSAPVGLIVAIQCSFGKPDKPPRLAESDFSPCGNPNSRITG
jgi:hypothetical protein